MTYRPDIPHLTELQTTESTNSHAAIMARGGCPEYTIVWTHDQTAGKGRQGNTWTSFPGNLYVSAVFRPETDAMTASQLSFVAALALAETLTDVLPPTASVAVKWPNDVLVDGKKIAGILLEAESAGAAKIKWIIAGIGVNITGAPEGAASLTHFGVKMESGRLLEILWSRLSLCYNVWKTSGFEPVRQGWLRYAAYIGQQISVRLPGETFTGKFLGVDGQGVLEVETQDGKTRRVSSGEVFAL
jgi:BirA family biotin operon repressor/biotin-[acetyl-CoA-carboxylase] ligase